MDRLKVRFNTKEQPEFFRILSKRVNLHFTDNNISKHADNRMIFKTIFMLLLYFIPLTFLIFLPITNFGPMMLCWIIMGFGMAGIGLSVMHDANHGSYSSNPKINQRIGFVINFIGGYHHNWKIQHNVLHHSFTNIDGHDDDINKKLVFRMSPDQERKSIFRFQAFYAPFLYGMITIYWFLGKDFEQLVKYNKQNLLNTQGVTFSKALVQIIFNKAWYLLLTIGLPLIILPLPVWQILIGFFLMHFICGIILGLIFQPAHVIEETDFFKPDAEGNVENNWAIHQLKTTANFANKSKFFSWFIGGLNYQIEHHLFPNICHIHYKAISKIVKQTALEYELPYHHHETFYGAVRSHFAIMNKLGNGRYDAELALKNAPA